MVFTFIFAFLFKVERGELKEGQLWYKQLSKFFQGYIIYGRGDNFKVVVPFCFECLIYRMTEKGTFWLDRFYNVGNVTRRMKLQGAIRTLIETGILKISVYGKSSPLSLNSKNEWKKCLSIQKIMNRVPFLKSPYIKAIFRKKYAILNFWRYDVDCLIVSYSGGIDYIKVILNCFCRYSLGVLDTKFGM